jgi:hypothetical protein
MAASQLHRSPFMVKRVEPNLVRSKACQGNSVQTQHSNTAYQGKIDPRARRWPLSPETAC